MTLMVYANCILRISCIIKSPSIATIMAALVFQSYFLRSKFSMKCRHDNDNAAPLQGSLYPPWAQDLSIFPTYLFSNKTLNFFQSPFWLYFLSSKTHIETFNIKWTLYCTFSNKEKTYLWKETWSQLLTFFKIFNPILISAMLINRLSNMHENQIVIIERLEYILLNSLWITWCFPFSDIT